ARWLLATSGGPRELDQLAELLDSDNATFRLVTAYALQWLKAKGVANQQESLIQQKLHNTAEQEAADSAARPYLLSAAWILAKTEVPASRGTLLEAAQKGKAISDRTVASVALAERGTDADVPLLLNWMDDQNADVQAAAAAGLLRISRRSAHRLAPLDWSVIGLYFVGMLAIGWFYSFRTETTDDYLLGGRKMKPWTVGLSLFATLCSTISYLSTPGEMVQHGPMFLMSIAAYPVVTLVIGWWLIPYFMKLPVTSAYEILESRLGIGIRLLGATFFLTMRLLWMAVILDTTTKVVLLPLLGLDASYGIYICAVLGLSTVIYSSMGGIRAVVMTDVVQTFILLSGAIAALGLITWNLGGISGWWPTVWADNWDPPTLGFDPRSRMSLFGIFISTFFWYLCTAGSDQMAIQRYLSTRDVGAARRMFSISMITGVLVTILLSLLGLGLLAWFRLHPEMLGEGQSIAHNGDQLFPRFIVAGLPDGVSGLVVAGLLAAAMSSLSSGLSSSCAVITVDFFDRFANSGMSASRQVRRARYVSWGLGLVVVLLSSVVGLVKGNVLEVAFKVVNLLVAPLFGLFFMALFVRWATSFGTFVGAAAGLATVVAINYWTEFTGEAGISFLWAMPLGLLAQIGVGVIASLMPIGTSKPLA
ncbi:MAG: sglT 1, partial [Planctomycetaceae bacterium]|nr:sglT 1 [Planctomycetaceae bacterium]